MSIDGVWDRAKTHTGFTPLSRYTHKLRLQNITI